MSTVQEIESAILKLAPSQLSELSKWFDDHIERSWDARMEADAKAGKFDRFKQEIDQAKTSGKLIESFAQHAADLSAHKAARPGVGGG